MNANQPTPTSFYEAVSYLNRKDAVKIANNTYLERLDENTIGVRLHATYVIKFHRDEKERETTELNSGGYLSATTKERLNRYIPEGSTIVQSKGVWRYLANDVAKPVTAFYDGLTVDSLSGAVL